MRDKYSSWYMINVASKKSNVINHHQFHYSSNLISTIHIRSCFRKLIDELVLAVNWKSLSNENEASNDSTFSLICTNGYSFLFRIGFLHRTSVLLFLTSTFDSTENHQFNFKKNWLSLDRNLWSLDNWVLSTHISLLNS